MDRSFNPRHYGVRDFLKDFLKNIREERVNEPKKGIFIFCDEADEKYEGSIALFGLDMKEAVFHLEAAKNKLLNGAIWEEPLGR